MDQKAIVELLARTALFGTLDQQDRTAIAGRMRRTQFDPDQMIFSRGDPGREIYLVVDGRVRLSVFATDGRALSFKHANPGDIFGEIAVLDGGSRSADAIALTRVAAMTLSQAGFNRLVENNPRVARAAIAYLCVRLRQTSEQAETIALHPIEVRLARFFLAKLKTRDAGDSKLALDLGMSQSELALLVGASRQKVNAALASLEAGGALKRQAGRFVCNAAKLARIAMPA